MEKPITLCDRCDNQMICLLNYDGKLCRKSRTVEPTNADRIRAMSDEELAKFLAESATDKCAPGHYDCYPWDHCGECWLDWLREEET